ncbi:hypothetical protein IAT38_008251 [Cryptococcus sp. DSM 104549]
MEIRHHKFLSSARFGNNSALAPIDIMASPITHYRMAGAFPDAETIAPPMYSAPYTATTATTATVPVATSNTPPSAVVPMSTDDKLAHYSQRLFEIQIQLEAAHAQSKTTRDHLHEVERALEKSQNREKEYLELLAKLKAHYEPKRPPLQTPMRRRLLVDIAICAATVAMIFLGKKLNSLGVMLLIALAGCTASAVRWSYHDSHSRTEVKAGWEAMVVYYLSAMALGYTFIFGLVAFLIAMDMM